MLSTVEVCGVWVECGAEAPGVPAMPSPRMQRVPNAKLSEMRKATFELGALYPRKGHFLSDVPLSIQLFSSVVTVKIRLAHSSPMQGSFQNLSQSL